jgi:hypothetical protein
MKASALAQLAKQPVQRISRDGEVAEAPTVTLAT